MSKPKKWATRCKPTSPVSVVARACIEYRLKSVWRFARLASKEAVKDAEHVHQLRVSVRRATAAIKLYAPLLSRKKARRIRKRLRGLRRAAGPARDLDVLANSLARRDAAHCEKDLEDLCRIVGTHRAGAQPALKRSYKEAKRKGFVKDIKRLVRSVKWRSGRKEPDFRTFARTTFEPILDRFFAAGEADLRDIGAMHKMRIEGKTVRYAMELLSPAFERSLREEIYPAFAEVQDKLGVINDHDAAIRFYRGLLKSADAQQSIAVIEQRIELEKTELKSSRLAFLDWWTAERTSELRRRLKAVIQPAQDECNGVINAESDATTEIMPHSPVG